MDHRKEAFLPLEHVQILTSSVSRPVNANSIHVPLCDEYSLQGLHTTTCHLIGLKALVLGTRYRPITTPWTRKFQNCPILFALTSTLLPLLYFFLGGFDFVALPSEGVAAGVPPVGAFPPLLLCRMYVSNLCETIHQQSSPVSPVDVMKQLVSSWPLHLTQLPMSKSISTPSKPWKWTNTHWHWFRVSFLKRFVLEYEGGLSVWFVEKSTVCYFIFVRNAEGLSLARCVSCPLKRLI